MAKSKPVESSLGDDGLDPKLPQDTEHLTVYFDARSDNLASCCSSLVRIVSRWCGRNGRLSISDFIRERRSRVL